MDNRYKSNLTEYNSEYIYGHCVSEQQIIYQVVSFVVKWAEQLFIITADSHR